MKGPTLVLSALALVFTIGCENPQQPDGRLVPSDPSKIITDGAHGGNKDFFFLPPMVPLPRNNPDFELGKFNNTFGPSLKIEICELNNDNLKPAPAPLTGMLPTELTTCGVVKKTFAPGTVQLVNLPLKQNGWWSALGLPADGFYYVLWDTRQSNLLLDKYYRIKVYIDGNPNPLGVADVDPMANIFQWKYSLTGEVIQMVDDVLLPIPFRIEKGGGSTLCGNSVNCSSAVITNNSTAGSQSVTVDAGGGSIAGAKFPNGWLPSGSQCPSIGPCPQSVVVTIAEVQTSGPGVPEGTVCHQNLPFTQFKGCFRYTTTPRLQPINEAGDRFAQPVTVAVCYELQGSGDPREKFAELYASDVANGEAPHALDDVPDGGLLGVETKDCTPPPVIGSTNPNMLVRLASNTWQRAKAGLGRVFGVKTAYAVDLGLGGIVKGFSNISPVLPASVAAEGPTDLGTQLPGARDTLKVMVTGSNHHAERAASGIGGVPVTFSVASVSQGSVLQALTAVGTVTPTSVESISSDDIDSRGEASAVWQFPNDPGTYTLTVTAKATGAPITFTVTVQPPSVTGFVGFDTPDIGANDRQVADPYTDAVTGVVFSAGPSGVIGISRNLTSGTSVCVAPLLPTGAFGVGDGNQKLGTAPTGSTSIGLSGFPIKATFPTLVPAGTVVSVEVQTGFGDGANVLNLRFLNAAGAEVGVVTQSLNGADVVDNRCDGAPGTNKRATVRFFTTATQSFKSLVIEGPAGTVFVIDNLRFGPPGSFD